jgi:hypothetical protein
MVRESCSTGGRLSPASRCATGIRLLMLLALVSAGGAAFGTWLKPRVVQPEALGEVPTLEAAVDLDADPSMAEGACPACEWKSSEQ